MRILIACEESATVRDLFADKGHEAWSCDLKPSRSYTGNHYRGSVFDILDQHWDMMIGHPPCTRLTVAGNAWRRNKENVRETELAIKFFMALANAPIPKICLENPVGIMSTEWRQPDQIIQPFQFGDDARKATCLWLKGLPKLFWTDTPDLFSEKTSVEPSIIEMKSKKTGKVRTYSKWEYKASKDHRFRAETRSKTFPGIAKAMADQWG